MSEQEKQSSCKILQFPVPQRHTTEIGLVTLENTCIPGSWDNLVYSSVSMPMTVLVVAGNLEFAVGVEYGNNLDMSELLQEGAKAYAEVNPQIAEQMLLLTKMIKGETT